jgi:DNA gyrase subunit A
VNSKTGKLIGVATLKDAEHEVIVISNSGQTIRLGLKDIPEMSRATQGVRIMRLNDGDKVSSMSIAPTTPEIDDDFDDI